MNVRPATRDDFEAIADVFRAADEAVSGRPSSIDVDAVDGWLQTISLERNTWLLEENGAVVGAAFAQLFGELGNSAGAVRPSARGRGLGARLADLVETRLTEEGARRMHTWTVAGDSAADDLFGARGFTEARRFWDMAIELDAEPPEPAVPVEAFGEEDALAFHEALDEAFSEHWEHDSEPFEEWWARQRRRENFDPSLWFVIRDGDELAGVARNEARALSGYVGALGVRRAWRGRGYGRALLLHTFREFRRRGLTRATLGVDASNATGATRLYESVGMYVEQENVVWQKVLA
jgi:mycothiol synthase